MSGNWFLSRDISFDGEASNDRGDTCLNMIEMSLTPYRTILVDLSYMIHLAVPGAHVFSEKLDEEICHCIG